MALCLVIGEKTITPRSSLNALMQQLVWVLSRQPIIHKEIVLNIIKVFYALIVRMVIQETLIINVLNAHQQVQMQLDYVLFLYLQLLLLFF